MDTLMTCLGELVVANRILAREGVVDAFGHISVRHPDNPERYFMSRSRERNAQYIFCQTGAENLSTLKG